MLFPETILRSIGYGGVATVLIDMLAALTVLPALLAVLGPKVNALRIRRSVQRPPAAETSGGWYRLAHSVMRRPLLYAVPIVVLLLALGSPFLKVVWGGVDATVLPSSAAPRIVTEALNRDFPGNPTAPIEALVQFRGPVAASQARAAGLAAYASRLDHVPGVTAAQVTGVHGHVARIDLSYGPGPYTPQARAIAGQVRDVAAPPGATAQVGGQTAALADQLSSIGHTLPWMALAVVIATFVLLFLAFGSLILPLEAIVANILSLSAMYGVVTWIFQDGHLSGLLGFTPNGTISPTIPVLMFAIMFGLSMDYEVFLLSRIRERYVATGDNTAAIASGLQRTGGVITSAALLLVIVIGMFSLSSITFIKLLGVGMIVALVLDATLVRLLLVPATMRLLGHANWWAPAPLRRLYARYGIREDSGPGPAPVAEPAARAGPHLATRHAATQPATRPPRHGRTAEMNVDHTTPTTSARGGTQHLARPGGRVGYDVAQSTRLLTVLVPGMGDLRGGYRFLPPALRAAATGSRALIFAATATATRRSPPTATRTPPATSWPWSGNCSGCRGRRRQLHGRRSAVLAAAQRPGSFPLSYSSARSSATRP